MYMTIMSSFIAMFIPILVFSLSLMLTMRTLNDREKSSPFECGFDPNHSARIPFSMRFFLLAIIFTAFDIEIVLLISTPMLITSSNLSSLMYTMVTFLLILIIGLLYEWNEGSLKWSK